MFWLGVTRNSEIPLIRQVYEQIRLKILKGELQPGERLLSTRELASELNVSRNVILEAYEQLAAEGYLTGRGGSGTYVAEGAYLEDLDQDGLSTSPDQQVNAQVQSVNTRVIDFRTGVPALDWLPRKKMGQLFYAACTDSPSAIFDYWKPEGCPELRNTLSRYLARTRGVGCDPDQIVITTGAAQALFLTGKALLSPGDRVIVEDPLHLHFQNILLSCGASLCPVPVDERGMVTERATEEDRARMVCATPSHHFPLGGVLPVQRRIELVQFAKKTGCYIVEDDYESEFRFEGTAVSSLQGLSPEQVIYIGSFSKILAPALRIGYLVLPHALIERFREFKYLLDNHTPILDQLVLASFIENRDLEFHVARMKKLYKKRQLTLIKSLDDHFHDMHRVIGSSTGLHLVAEFERVMFTESLLTRLEVAGVRVYPVEAHALHKGRYLHQVILGYGNLTEEEISEGVKRIKDVLASGLLES
jgi:GntR family transcriptional regulator/MocR family aminotransferase